MRTFQRREKSIYLASKRRDSVPRPARSREIIFISFDSYIIAIQFDKIRNSNYMCNTMHTQRYTIAQVYGSRVDAALLAYTVHRKYYLALEDSSSLRRDAPTCCSPRVSVPALSSERHTNETAALFSQAESSFRARGNRVYGDIAPLKWQQRQMHDSAPALSDGVA